MTLVNIPNRIFIASSIEAVSNIISSLCSENGIAVTKLKQEQHILRELIDGKFKVLFVEYGFLEDRNPELIQKIRECKLLEDLFVVVFAPVSLKDKTGITSGCNVIFQPPFTQVEILKIFKRAFALPKEIFFVTPNPEQDFVLVLQKMGYRISTKSSAVEFFKDAEINPPDYVIFEYALSDMSGIDLYQKSTQLESLRDIPFMIAYSGRDAGDIEAIIKSGIPEIILSPYASPKNIKKIQDLLPLTQIGRRLRALVVDDSPTIRSLIVSMFNELDYHVDTASNGFEGYKAVEMFSPDIITSDYDMPILNGWQFCSEVRDHEKYKDIPIIMISTRSTELDLKKGELLGVSSYLTKPFSKDQLSIAIESAILSAKQKKEKETIAKFITSDALKKIGVVAGGNDDENGEDKFITILFSDICEFSKKCEKYSARKIVLLLNSYFDLMVETLYEHNAIVDKFIGDAIVARFDSGDPETDARNAVSAAWRMQERLDAFNSVSFEEIQIRIGINSGSVILGNLGSHRHRLEYAMVGDHVNISQRLESIAPIARCLISESTYELTKDYIMVGDRQELSVKGKADIVAAYLLEGIK